MMSFHRQASLLLLLLLGAEQATAPAPLVKTHPTDAQHPTKRIGPNRAFFKPELLKKKTQLKEEVLVDPICGKLTKEASKASYLRRVNLNQERGFIKTWNAEASAFEELAYQRLERHCEATNQPPINSMQSPPPVDIISSIEERKNKVRNMQKSAKHADRQIALDDDDDDDDGFGDGGVVFEF